MFSRLRRSFVHPTFFTLATPLPRMGWVRIRVSFGIMVRIRVSIIVIVWIRVSIVVRN